MRFLLLLAVLSAATPAAERRLTDSEQLQLVRLLFRREAASSMANYCGMWAEKYRAAYKLSGADWAKFQARAPRHLGNGKPYDVEYDEQAAEYEKRAKELDGQIVEKAKALCPSGTTRIAERDGVISCE